MPSDPVRAQAFCLRLPRHPLLRLLAVAGGALVLAGVLAMGVIVGTLAVAITAGWLVVRRWLGSRGHRRRDPSIIEGEFSVVRDSVGDALPPGD
jgi:hypothetical protein